MCWIALAALAFCGSASSQVVFDGTLRPENDGVTPPPSQNADYLISSDLGITVDSRNLFHSFREFSIGESETALFTGPDTIEHVISRVTGDDVSQIFGMLRSEIAGADLYLLNPNGVVFGPNASIDVRSSLHVSTAESLQLMDANGNLFEAFSPASLLVFADPVAFRFLDAHTAPIEVQTDLQSVGGLRIGNAQSLTLTGGDITLTAGAGINGTSRSGEGGRVSLVSVQGPGAVRFAPSDPGAPTELTGFERLGAVSLARGSEIQTSGTRGGRLVIRGGDLVMVDAQIRSFTKGIDAEPIDISVRGDVSLNDGSAIAATTTAGGTGAPIRLDAGGQILVASDSRLVTTTAGIGTGGPLSITAQSLLIDGSGAVGDQTGIATDSINASAPTAVGGDISIAVEHLDVLSGGSIRTSTTAGTGGDVVVHADQIRISGEELKGPAPTVVATSTIGPGHGGDVRLIVGESLELRQGGEVQSLLLPLAGRDIGTGGNIVVDAPEATVVVDGFPVVAGNTDLSIPSGFITQAQPLPMGSDPAGTPGTAGSIDLTASHLEITNGGLLGSDTFSTSAAGDIHVETESVIVSGFNGAAADFYEALGVSRDVARSQIRSRTDPAVSDIATGAAGGIAIVADELEISDRGRISADSTGPGDAGSIDIEVGTLELSTQPGGDLSDILAGSFAMDPPAGASGSISIVASEKISIDNGVISVLGRNVPGGTLELTAPVITVAGEGGISSRADGDFTAGDIRIDAGNTLRAKSYLITTESGSADGGNIFLDSGRLLVLEDTTVSATVRAEDGRGGNVAIAAPGVVLDSATVIANAQDGPGGNISVTADVFIASPDTVLDASSETGVDGTVIINAPVHLQETAERLPISYLNASALLRPSCAAQAASDSAGSFMLAHRQNAPASPEGLLVSSSDVAADDVASLQPALPAELVVAANAPTTAVTARAAFDNGAAAYRSGEIDRARRHWERASQLYAQSGAVEAQLDALHGVALSQQASGDYTGAIETLLAALSLAEESGESANIVWVLGSLGNAHLAIGNDQTAENLLARGIELAIQSSDTRLAYGILNDLGEYHATRGKFDRALYDYERSSSLAARHGDIGSQAKALSNAARMALRGGQSGRAHQLVQTAQTVAGEIPKEPDKVYALIHVARTYQQLAEVEGVDPRKTLLRAHASLTAALEAANAADDARARSYAYGNLGALYLADGRTDDALYLVRRALQAAIATDVTDATYRWHWLEAQLLWKKGRASESLDAYRRSITLLDENRPADRYGSTAAHFRVAVTPVYLDFVGTLLRASDLAEDAETRQALFREARSTVESFRVAELRDYFRDDCVTELEFRRKSVDWVDSRTAVVYPVMLPDRLELLVSLPAGIHRFTVDIGGARIRDEAHAFRRELGRSITRRFAPHAERLHGWLVKPYADLLEEVGIETLVFVPDGALRIIPMAALNDGRSFLAERYAVATAPSLSLIDPRPLEIESPTVLLGGVSEAVQGFSALAMVPDELNGVAELVGGEVLLDSAFSAEAIRTRMESSRPNIVHFASHTHIDGDPERSFLLTYDGRINMNQLESLIGPSRFGTEPIELLILSACETAVGDERAALGLAGVAVRSGARSALGSLWSISDEATYRLITDFYRALKQPGTSRAGALRSAQVKLIESGKWNHPYFWSSFIMINNWL